ncbi:fimbrial protein [Pseudomonas sp. Pseusp97]|uniref:fimbrial protein n=1 Tax=Pseudomonas sp. Pseusp97 TaxID=3243065 RepID=UPI0039A62A9A
MNEPGFVRIWLARILPLLLAAANFLWMEGAHAVVTCTPTAGITLTLPATIVAPRDRVLGTPLSNWISSAITRMENSCTTSDSSTTYGQARVVLAPTGKTVVDAGTTYELFATSLPGVGLIMQARDNGASLKPIAATPTDLVKGWSTYWDFLAGVRLIATGEPMGTGSLAATTVGEAFVAEKSSGTTSARAPIKITSTSVTAQTCSVDAGSVNLNVSLGTTSAPALAGPVGTTAGNASFNVRINCSTGMNVYMTLTDANNLGNTSDTLSLSPASSQARGVGIQIRRNGTPVRFGPDSSMAGTANQMSLGASPNGVLDIPFTANYIKTHVVVSPGEANAVATYTFSYQ